MLRQGSRHTLSGSCIHAGMSRLAMQHAPNIHVVRTLDGEHKVRMARQLPDAQVGQVEFVGVARRASGGVAADAGVGLLQRVDETESDGLAGFVQVLGNRTIHIPVGPLTRDHGLGYHAWVVGLAALRTRSRRPSK